MSSQRQSGGDQSTNIQAATVNIVHGLTVEEARTIAYEVFSSNFYQLAGDAATIARQRAEEITENFLKQLQSKNEAGLTLAKDPDFQYALFTVCYRRFRGSRYSIVTLNPIRAH